MTQAIELEQQSATDEWSDWMDSSTSVSMLPEQSFLDVSDAWFSVPATESSSAAHESGCAAAAPAANAMDNSSWMDEPSTLTSPNASGWMRQKTAGGLPRRSNEPDALAIAKQQLLKINAVIQEHEATEAALSGTPEQNRGISQKPSLNELSQSQSNSVAQFHPGGSGAKKAAVTKGGLGSGGNTSSRRASGDKKKGGQRSKIPKKVPSKKASARRGSRGLAAGSSTGQFTVQQ